MASEFSLDTILCVVKMMLMKSAWVCMDGLAETKAALNGCWTIKN